MVISLSQTYFSFDGRIGRQTFWLKGVLLLSVIALVLVIVSEFVDRAVGAGGVLFLILVLLILWPSLAVQVKRWHDRGKSGWWVLIGLIPLIGGIWVLIECGFLEGTSGPNQYGDETF